MNKHTDPTDSIDKAKTEILEDIATGTVPATVTRFAQLHDFVDANEYGGLCDMPFDPSQAAADFANTVQDAVDAWLVAGRP